MKLASYYTILDHTIRSSEDPVRYSYDAGPVDTLGYTGNSEFLQSTQGRNTASVMLLMDELMSTLQVISPRLYSGVMRKLKEVE